MIARARRPLLSFFVTCIAAAACALAVEPPPATRQSAESAAARAAPTWQTRIAPAFAEAQRSGKLVLVDLFADWCSWCHKMDEEVFAARRFHELSQRFVLLRVDVEDRGEGTALRDRFHVETMPSLLLLDGKQVRVGAIEGFLAIGPLVERIDREIATWNDLVEAFEAGKYRDDRELFQKLVGELHERGDGRRAAFLYREILAADPPDSVRRWTRYMLADALRLAGELAVASTELAGAREETARAGDSELLERIDMLRFYIEQDRGNCIAAKSALEGFLRDYPQSSQALQVRGLLRVLKLEGAPHCV